MKFGGQALQHIWQSDRRTVDLFLHIVRKGQKVPSTTYKWLSKRVGEWLNEWTTEWMSEGRKLHPCVTHQKPTLGDLLIPHSTLLSGIHLLPSLLWCPLSLRQRLNLCKQPHHYRRPHVWGGWALECTGCEDNTGSHRCPSSFQPLHVSFYLYRLQLRRTTLREK